jgi:ABC-type multidrug transport system ATPase subunit
VLDQLLNYRQGKTTILISHRPKVIQRADWIIMLEKGKLKIQGTPEDLSSLAGEHLDFLDNVVPSTQNLVLQAASFSAQGDFSNNGNGKAANLNHS